MKPTALQGLYHQTILEHAVDPHGFEARLNTTHQASRDNLVCGDHVEVRLEIDQSEILQAAFAGESCAICTASASLLCTHAPGNSLAEFKDSATRLLRTLQAGANPLQTELEDKLFPLIGVLSFPARINCARLPWLTALNALDIKIIDN